MSKSPLIIVAKTHTVQQTELFMVWTGALSCWQSTSSFMGGQVFKQRCQNVLCTGVNLQLKKMDPIIVYEFTAGERS